jgi:hypothetical protein
VDAGKEISGEFVVACCDGSKVLESIEEAFDQVTFAVQREIARPRGLAIGLWGDHRGDSALGEAIDEPIGVVGLVANQGIWIGAVDQQFCASQIVGLPWREHQVDGIAQSIDERVDFGGQSAARPPDRLPAVFFRAPALCW